MTFLLKNWLVSVRDRGSAQVVACTRGQALADCWRGDAFGNLTFGQFLGIARCRRAPDPEDWGAPITVEGRPAYYAGRNSQYVKIAYPGGKFALNCHPSDVLPEQFRPAAYHTVAARPDSTQELASQCVLETYPPRVASGQYAGGVPSGVRATHTPTGITAACHHARSQHVNRLIALDMIMAALTHPQYRP